MARSGQAQQRRQVQLAGRGLQQVRAPHHLADALGGVVDHHRQVIGGRAVAAAHHQVVDHAALGAEQAIVELHRGMARVQAQGGRAPRSLALCPLLGRERRGTSPGRRPPPACRAARRRPRGSPRACSSRGRAGRPPPASRWRLGSPPSARTGVPPARPSRCPSAARSASCPASCSGREPPRVEVLHAHEEARPRRAGEQPRQQRGAQVAQVQRAARPGSEAAVARAARQRTSPRAAARKPASSSLRAWSAGSGERSRTTPSRTPCRRALATRQRPAATV